MGEHGAEEDAGPVAAEVPGIGVRIRKQGTPGRSDGGSGSGAALAAGGLPVRHNLPKTRRHWEASFQPNLNQPLSLRWIAVL